jgi:hypothetical protein
MYYGADFFSFDSYGSQHCDPGKDHTLWNKWHGFEVRHGNEDTFRDMLRIKRSVQLQFSQQHVNTTDTAAALTRFGDLGLRLWIEDDGGISVLEGDPARLRVFLITAPTEPTVVEGRLFLPSDPITPAEWNGYLLIEGDHPKSGWAPILLREGEGGYWVDSYPAGEGLPVPDKRGCAWYFGRPDDGGCDLDAAVYLHTPTFEGSISFRCAADPLP